MMQHRTNIEDFNINFKTYLQKIWIEFGKLNPNQLQMKMNHLKYPLVR